MRPPALRPCFRSSAASSPLTASSRSRRSRNSRLLGPLPESWTSSAPLPGGDIGGGHADALGPALSRLHPTLATHWPGAGPSLRHARDAPVDGVTSRAGMGESFGGGLTRLEVDYLVREEWARSAEDILWRHTKCGLFAMPEDVERLREYVEPMSHVRCRSVSDTKVIARTQQATMVTKTPLQSQRSAIQPTPVPAIAEPNT